MLVHLDVRDLAIVDNLELELAPGMTVLTGETGAGKSLLVDALELAVGERARAGLVRAGAASAEVHAVFEPDEPVRNWLAEHELNDDDGCVLRRVVSADGRSRAWINGRPVAVSQLSALGEQLVDVHGQHAHQSLLQGATQRAVLDAYGDHGEALATVRALHAELEELHHAVRTLEDAGNDVSRLDYIRFQLQELDGQPLDPALIRGMDDEHRRLSHGADLLAAAAQVHGLLDDEGDGARAMLNAALRELDAAMRLDPTLADPVDLLRECAALLGDADQAIRRYRDGLELDESRLAELERALAALHELARKHRCAPEDLAARRQELRDEAQALATGSQRLEQARAEHEQAVARYREAANTLSALRERSARSLEESVNAILETLGMEGAAIRFALEQRAHAAPTAHGLDSIVLQAITNPKQPPQPLARVASGGELSRIALAVHAASVSGSPAHTLVFDEVDVGVGGAVAEIVGRRMRLLGKRRQVLAVTHMPQLAALAHQQVAVHKQAGDDGSQSSARLVFGEERVQELARMLGGVSITRETREHARELLRAGQEAAHRDDDDRRPAA